MYRHTLILALVLLLSSACSSQYGEQIPADYSERFQRLSKLEGDWVGVALMPDGEEQVKVNYQLTSGGSALVEKIFAGTNKEMVSIYHLDKDDITMTHYCMLENQPRLRTKAIGDSNRLEFQFADGTGMRSENDPHMHEMVMSFMEDGSIHQEWTMFSEGEATNTTTIKFRRLP